MASQVYFARRADGTGPIKIGVSGSVDMRLRQLSWDMKECVVPLATAPGGFRDEGRLHRQYAADRLHGEWFTPSPDVLAGLAHVQQFGTLPPAPAEDRDVVIERRYLEGETLQSIGNDFGLTRERVRQLLRANGVPSLGHRKEHVRQAEPVSDFEREIAATYSEGKTAPDSLLDQYGINASQLAMILRRTGTKRFGAGYWRTRPDDAERTQQVVSLYGQGMTGKDIAAAVGLKDQTHVYRYLAKAGIAPKRQNVARFDNEQLLVDAYLGGKTYKQVGSDFGCPPWAVQRVVRRHGATLSPAESERRRIAAVVAAHQRRTRASA